MNRRDWSRWLLAAGTLKAVGLGSAHAASDVRPAAGAPVRGTAEAAEQHHLDAMARHARFLEGPKLTIAMLIYPGMFLQDLVGPLTVFEALMNRDIHLVWKDKEPVGSGSPSAQALIPVRATTTLSECPKDVDVLFVPGGVPGTFAMMQDREVLDFLADRGSRARFVTSVCTGSLILGAAGLLTGFKATSHWATVPVLKEFGAIPRTDRIVQDRNRITGGGVTAGIDFGLKLVALLRSEDYAKAVQLYIEYNPQPPFNAGTPDKAPKAAKAFLDDMFAGMVDTATTLARQSRMK